MIALAPGVALAQAVPPPKKPLVGPPIDYSGEKPAPNVTRNITWGAPGPAVDGVRSTAETIATNAGSTTASATLVDTVGVNKLIRYTDTLEGMDLADGLEKSAKRVGVLSNLVGAGANIGVMATKCSGATYNGSECAQTGFNAASNYVNAAGLAVGSEAIGKVGNAVQLGADLVGLQRNCTDPNAPTGSCVMSAFDSAMSAGATFVPGGEVPAAGYSIAKSVLPGAYDAVSQAIYGQSLGYEYYDAFQADKDNARIEAESKSPKLLEEQRARRRAAYQQTAGALIQKQEAYDAEQARMEAERQAQIAAQQQAMMQAQANQQFVNNMIGIQQSLIAQQAAPIPQAAGSDPCAWIGGCDLNLPFWMQNGAAAPAPAPAKSAPPPSSSGGCSLTAEDRAKGRVCTAN